MTEREKWLVEFAVVMAREGWTDANEIGRLVEIAGSLHRLAEMACNCTLSPRQEARQERLEKEAASLAPENFSVVTDRDPRGCSLFVVVPSGCTDDWGQRGISVPSR